MKKNKINQVWIEFYFLVQTSITLYYFVFFLSPPLLLYKNCLDIPFSDCFLCLSSSMYLFSLIRYHHVCSHIDKFVTIYVYIQKKKKTASVLHQNKTLVIGFSIDLARMIIFIILFIFQVVLS